MLLRLATFSVNITIIQAYSPTRDYDDEEVELFYDNDIVVNSIDEWMYAVGKFALGKTNAIGLRLLEFAYKYHKSQT